MTEATLKAPDVKFSHDEVKAMMKRDIESGQYIRPLNEVEKSIYGNAAMNVTQRVPAFSGAVALLQPFVDATAETCYVDRYGRVGLSYFFLYAVDYITRATWLIHETMHVLNSHFVRAESVGTNPMEMNICGDLEINTTLSTMRWCNLETGILPEMFDLPQYKTFEIYHGLRKQQQLMDEDNIPQDNSQGQPGGESSDSGNGSGSGDNSDASDSSNSDNNGSGSGNSSSESSSSGSAGDSGDNDGSDNGSGSSSSSSSNGDSGNSSGSGSGSSNQPTKGTSNKSAMDDLQDRFARDLENGKKGDGGGSGSGGNGSGRTVIVKGTPGEGKGGSVDAKGTFSKDGKHACDRVTEERERLADEQGIERTSETAQEIARQDTRVRIKHEIQQANSKNRSNYGSSHDFYNMMIELMSPPKVDWRKIFRKVMANSFSDAMIGRNYQSYRRVNRRYNNGNVIFPGSVDYMPTAMIGIDTSGSMGKEDYRTTLVEVENITTKVCRAKRGVPVFAVDTEIKDIQIAKSVKDIDLSGGGGTDMAVAFKYVNELPKKKKPNIFVLSTDGHVYWDTMIEELKKATYKAIILVTDADMATVPDEAYNYATILPIGEENSKTWNGRY